MKVTVVGAGNMGMAMAGYMSKHNKGKIVVFSRKDILKNGKLQVNDIESNESYVVDNFICTDNPEKAFAEANVIFITYPAFLRKDFVNNFGKFIKEGTYLGFVPGYGGIEYSCGELLERGVKIFGFQRVPYVARVNSEEKVANILSKKGQLYIGAIPNSQTETICKIVEQLLDIPVQPLKEYLSITLAPSNPLLHITGLYNVFKDYKKGDVYSRQLRFYEEWNDETSEILFEYDNELQNICKALVPLDLSEVVPLPIYYESLTPQEMTKKLKNIEAFKSVLVPLINTKEGYYIDLKSRMFIEDYPFGVCVIKDFARMTGVNTPTIDMLLRFYERLSNHRYFEINGKYTKEIEQTGIPGINGLLTVDDIIKFYHK